MFSNTEVLCNKASSNGGGILMDGAAKSTLRACKVAQNAASAFGGGLLCSGHTFLTIIDSLVVDNTGKSSLYVNHA